MKRTQNEGAKKRKAILFGLLFGAVITLLLGLSVLFLASPTEKEIVEEKPIVVEAPIEENEGELVFDEPLEFEEPTAPELIEALVIAKTLRNQASSRALSSSDSLSKRETSKLRGKKEKKEEKKAVKTKENPKTTTVRFTSIPSNAVVKINNVRVGKTPLSRSYSDPSVSLNVSFSHIGYTTSRVRFSPEKRTKLHVKLKQSRLKIE